MYPESYPKKSPPVDLNKERESHQKEVETEAEDINSRESAQKVRFEGDGSFCPFYIGGSSEDVVVFLLRLFRHF